MTLEQYLTETLGALAAAREYEASFPSVSPRVARVTCADCGSDNAHRLWVSFSERCRSEWHNNYNTPEEG